MKIVTHKNFTPYDLLNWIADAPLKPGPKAVLLALARYVQKTKNGNRVYPGQHKIATKANVSLRCVNGHIHTLCELGYIVVESRDVGNGYRKPNDYFLNVGFSHSAEKSPCAESAYGHTQKTTKPVSKSAYEGENKKEIDIEKKLEGKDTSKQSSTPCDVQNSNKEDEQGKKKNVEICPKSTENSFAPAVYEWKDSDSKAARAFVWHDLFAGDVMGRPIVERVSLYGENFKHLPLDPDTQRLIDASKLVSDFALNCLKAPKARVAFWYQCGRLFYPQSPKFFEYDSKSKRKKLTNNQSKALHAFFDELGSRGCYVLAHIMSTWPNAPTFELLEEHGADALYADWLKTMIAVQLPDTKHAYDLAGKRYAPHRQAEFDATWQSIALKVVEQNASADTLSSQDPDEFVFVAGPSKQQPIAGEVA